MGDIRIYIYDLILFYFSSYKVQKVCVYIIFYQLTEVHIIYIIRFSDNKLFK